MHMQKSEDSLPELVISHHVLRTELRLGGGKFCFVLFFLMWPLGGMRIYFTEGKQCGAAGSGNVWSCTLNSHPLLMHCPTATFLHA